jgi:hypothetical protein
MKDLRATTPRENAQRTQRRPVVLCVLCAFSLGVVARNSVAEEPVFVAHTVGGTLKPGILVQLKDDWSLKVGRDRTTDVAAGDLISLRRLGQRLPPPPDGAQLVLANGDRVPCEFVGFTDDRVRVRLPAEWGENRDASLPPTAVSLVWLADPDDADSPAQLRKRLATQQRSRDVVLLRNGDTVEGVLLGASADVVEVEVNRKPVRLPRARVSAVAFSTELGGDLGAKGPYARLVLAGGARLSLARASYDGEALKGVTLFDAPVRVPLGSVVGLTLHQARAVYLSDLKPKREDRVEVSPSLTWPAVRDGSADGRDILLKGESYDKGLGTHSECRLTYDVSGGYRRFEALVGLDDVAGQLGSVRVKVLVDGKPVDVGWDRELTARDPALSVSVPLEGAKELTLVVEFGRRLDVGDHVNWAEARLVK